ncbi:acyltransferase 3 [Apodospora peruviana]|uniref:Acyltransferase 3 n=1 Tax=Apodospora peruviana TaxID=516989 RepID=A0AAE0HZW3_9PEZI|nr:acyltransferase 3 [Apodospora peruviana]
MASQNPNPIIVPVSKKARRHDIDNLRSFCTAHVIAHHTAIAYGGIDGAMPPHSALFDKASPLFTPFIATNLAYGMGLYFWLSGKMTAQSLSRSKSDTAFIKSKLWRIGVPTLVYSAFIHPLQTVIEKPRKDFKSNIKAYFDEVRSLDGVKGPVWYNATLLVFDIAAVVLGRMLSAQGKASRLSLLAKIYGPLARWGWLGVAGASFLLRTKLPPGKFMPVIGVQPAYLLQYIYAYCLGHVAFHLGKPRVPGPDWSVYKAFAVSLATLPLLFVPNFLKKKGEDGEEGAGGLELGGWNWTAAIYAAWQEFSFVTIAPAVMAAFERNYNHPAGAGIWSPRYSYAAFLLHPPVSWIADMGVTSLLCPGGERPAWMNSRVWQEFGPLLMTTVMSAVNIAGSFGLGRVVINYVPGVSSIL